MNIWVDKYRPTCFDEIILEDKIKNVIKGYLNKKTISNILLYGKPGIGKTLLVQTIAKELNATTLFINASVENGIDTVKSKIVDFANSVGWDGGPFSAG